MEADAAAIDDRSDSEGIGVEDLESFAVDVFKRALQNNPRGLVERDANSEEGFTLSIEDQKRLICNEVIHSINDKCRDIAELEWERNTSDKGALPRGAVYAKLNFSNEKKLQVSFGDGEISFYPGDLVVVEDAKKKRIYGTISRSAAQIDEVFLYIDVLIIDDNVVQENYWRAIRKCRVYSMLEMTPFLRRYRALSCDPLSLIRGPMYDDDSLRCLRTQSTSEKEGAAGGTTSTTDHHCEKESGEIYENDSVIRRIQQQTAENLPLAPGEWQAEAGDQEMNAGHIEDEDPESFAVDDTDDMSSLNDIQRKAIRDFKRGAGGMFLWMAPAGTGKTTTITEAIEVEVRKGNSVLVTAPSNNAVLNLLEKYAKYNSTLRKIFFLGDKDKLKERSEGLLKFKFDPEENSLQGVNVMFSTLSSSAKYYTRFPEDFPSKVALIVDEAGQATISETFIPFEVKPYKILLVGDPMQLPPTVKCEDVKDEGGDKSLLSYLLIDKPPVFRDVYEPRHFFKNGYRMDPEINEWPSKSFYEGELTAHYSPPVSIHDSPHFSLSSPPYVVINVRGKEDKDDNGKVRNIMEVLTVVKAYKKLYKSSTFNNTNIKIITPYKAQAEQIKKYLKKILGDNKVGTIDDFQGSEADIVLVSMVRANSKGSLGFINDRRRLNVGLTRAKRLLVVFASAATLEKKEKISDEKNYCNEMIKDARRRGIFYESWTDYSAEASNREIKSLIVRSKPLLLPSPMVRIDKAIRFGAIFINYANLIRTGYFRSPYTTNNDSVVHVDLRKNRKRLRDYFIGTLKEPPDQNFFEELNFIYGSSQYRWNGGVNNRFVFSNGNEKKGTLSISKNKAVPLVTPTYRMNGVDKADIRKFLDYYNSKKWLEAKFICEEIYDRAWKNSDTSLDHKMWVITALSLTFFQFGDHFVDKAIDCMNRLIHSETSLKTLLDNKTSTKRVFDECCNNIRGKCNLDMCCNFFATYADALYYQDYRMVPVIGRQGFESNSFTNHEGNEVKKATEICGELYARCHREFRVDPSDVSFRSCFPFPKNHSGGGSSYTLVSKELVQHTLSSFNSSSSLDRGFSSNKYNYSLLRTVAERKSEFRILAMRKEMNREIMNLGG